MCFINVSSYSSSTDGQDGSQLDRRVDRKGAG